PASRRRSQVRKALHSLTDQYSQKVQLTTIRGGAPGVTSKSGKKIEKSTKNNSGGTRSRRIRCPLLVASAYSFDQNPSESFCVTSCSRAGRASGAGSGRLATLVTSLSGIVTPYDLPT